MSIWIKRFLVLDIILLLHLGTVFAQKNKNSDDINSAFDESLSEELAEGFDDIEAADEEEFGAPKTPVQTEEDLISEEFESLEEEEFIVEDKKTQPTQKGVITTDKAQEPTDEDLDAEFTPDELEREEVDEEVIAETPKEVEQIDQELEEELKEDRLEQEEDTEIADTKQPEDVIVEDDSVEEQPIAEEQKTVDEEDQADLVQQTDEVEEEKGVTEDQPLVDEEEPKVEDQPIVEEEEPESEDVDEQIELAEELEEIQEEPESVREEPESLALLPDQPNIELEMFLDRIFKANFDRLSDERWGQITQSIQEDTYRIQVGDTLWDISVTFFGNGHFWPKLWQLNDSITNPHLIYPGQFLRFISGGVETAPYVEVTDVQQEEQEQQDQEVQQQVADIEEDIEEGKVDKDNLLTIEDPPIPPPLYPRHLLKKIPESLLNSDLNLDKLFGSLSERNKIIIESVDSKIDDSYIQAFHFLSERPPRSFGKVVDVEDWHNSASILQHIYIQSPSLNIGNKYAVFKKKHSIKNPRTGRTLGNSIEFQGEVEVIRQMPYPRNIYKAIVRKHNTRLEEGSHVGVINIPRVKLNLEGRQQNIRAQIVGGGNTANPHNLFGAYSFVFLDRGSQSGISVGDILTVLRNQSVREEKSRFVQGDRPPIAKIKVVRVTPKTTTAFVLQSSTDIFIGDYTKGR